MANTESVKDSPSRNRRFKREPFVIFSVASTLLAFTFCVALFNRTPATAQEAVDERTIVMCETSNTAVRVYEKSDTADDCTIAVDSQPSELGRILERGTLPVIAENAEPETGDETTEMTVTGSLLYRARIALPPESVTEVKLLDISFADSPAVTIAEQTIVTAGEQVPIPFSIPYAADNLDPSATYIVSADIFVDNQLRWTTDTQYPVLTQGAPSDVDVLLVMTGSARQRPNAPESALPGEVESAVKTALAAKIGDAQVTVDSYSRQTWSDGCFGLGGPTEGCLAALTEGWEVVMVEVGTGDRYTYRTNEDGSAVRLDKNARQL